MIKPLIKNHLNMERINRHSSQLAIRKISATNGSSRDSQTDLTNIRKTTFWMKKTLGTNGTQNIPPNRRKNNQTRNNRHIFSIKTNTEHSQTQSTSHKQNEQTDKQIMLQQNTKLNLLRKSQSQLSLQVNMIAHQNLPKLATCYNLFNSLNKILKLGSKDCQKVLADGIDKLIDGHIQITNILFNKVLEHSKDFINTQKCNNLIAKVIELQKQNTRLIQNNINLESTISKLKQSLSQKQKQKETTNTSISSFPNKNINIKQLDLQRILITNYKIGQNNQLTQYKINQFCNKFITPLCNLVQLQQHGYFQTINMIMNGLTANKDGYYLLKQFVNIHKCNKIYNKTNNQNTGQQSLSKYIINQILRHKFDFNLLMGIKKKLLKFLHYSTYKSHDQNKISIKQLLTFLNKFTILKNNKQLNHMIIDLLQKSQIVQDNKQIQQQYIKNITEMLQQNCVDIYNKKQNDGLARLSAKRFVNCANLYQRKNKKQKNMEMLINQENQMKIKQHVNHKSMATNRKCDYKYKINQVIMLGYAFVIKQFQYLTQSTITLSKLSQNINYNSLIQKILIKQMYTVAVNRNNKQRQEIFSWVDKLCRLYGVDMGIKQQFVDQAIRQYMQIIKNQIIKSIINDERRLILSELVNWNPDDKNQ